MPSRPDPSPAAPPWDPAPLAEVVARFSVLECPWRIAGGHAVELAVGRPLRAHADIDVVVLRRDQHAARAALPDWEWWAADPPGVLRPWARGRTLPAGVHDLWCRPGPGEPWRVQVMLDEAEGDVWVSRRDARIRRPLAEWGAVSPEGIPYLAPEVQLFYKARDPRPRDEEDFAAALPVLDAAQRRWLADALALSLGDHPWTRRLCG
ncbi:nucleotidyltransferase domain-containing protein [Nocardiopsis sp. RV163]|uniref:nucleotidyltransferase domain-containing protein n=1 Tax=Nocardiopsis sp. RV163 TaxID=1661388 RepID=UPI00064C45BB|nr:hypothetical protein [Nocardiopsis sp. RV163]